MPTTIVRYELDPTRLDEHLALIDAVFEHLADTGPAGMEYEVFRSAEGMDFTHIATFEDEAAQQAFSGSDVFQAFTAEIGARCVVPPAAAPQTAVHHYRS